MNLTRILQNKYNFDGMKPFLWRTILFPAMVILGAMLAIYADSPFLIILLLGALTLASFAELNFALYILVAFLPFSFRFIVLPGTEMQIPTEPLLAIMAVALAIRWIIMGKRVHVRFPFRIPMLLYGASLCLSMINASHLYAAAKGSVRAISYMMLSVVVFNVLTDRQRLKQFFVASIVPATIAVGWTVIFLADRIEMWRWTSAYEGLPFTSYAHYGSFVSAILLILLARTIFDRGVYDRIIWIILLGFYGIAICFCFSRGVWLSFIIATGFLLLQRSEGIRSKKVLILIGAIMFFAVLLISVPHISSLIISRAGTILNFGYASNRERLLRWGTAIAMFLRHPIIGNGYGSFAFSYINNPEILGKTSRYGMGAHSEYLQALAETGLIGFFAWMWIIISFFIYGFRILRKIDENRFSFWRSLVIGTMSAELCLLIHFLVNNLVQAYIVGVPFWLLIGLLPVIGNIVEKENQSNAQ